MQSAYHKLKGRCLHGKVMILTFKDDEDQVLNKVLTLLSGEPKVITVQQDISPVFTFPGLTIYPYQRQVFREEKEIPLTHLEFSVLLYLAQQPGRVFSQQQIFEAVWNEDSETCQHSVVSIIHQLRKKIEPDPAQPVYIQTVIHTGYKFVVPKE